MRLNRRSKKGPRRTYEGALAFPQLTPLQELRRSVLACLLWEDSFYENGEAIADRIERLSEQIDPEQLASLAVEARNQFHLRHAPLLLATVLARTGAGRQGLGRNTIARVVQRADELAEFLALYWRKGRTPLSAQVKKGLAAAFQKFDAYELAKYNRQHAVRLRDVMFLVHPKPRDDTQQTTWRKLADNALESPDTWEVALSAGADKRETFERLLREGRLGYLALLRNLRNMTQAGVAPDLMRDAILARRGADRLLPFRFVAAARACPSMERELDQALMAGVREGQGFAGLTLVLVDVSGSMRAPLSRRSDLTRMDAAAALAALIQGDKRVFSFSSRVVEVPVRKGMAGIDAVIRSQVHSDTRLGSAVETLNRIAHDRLIVITDEQSHDRVPDPAVRLAYMINVASYGNGVGYGTWTHIDGFSERVIDFIHEIEGFTGTLQ